MKVIKKYLPYLVVFVIASFVSAEVSPWYRKGRAKLMTTKGGAQ